MMKRIKSFTIHGQGMRENNEDALLCNAECKNIAYFMVCDGVGGSQKGEVASAMASNAVAEYIKSHPVIQSEKCYVEEMLKYTDSIFDRYCEENPQSKGMGTTLALLIFYSDQALIVHVGDSRVYHIRKNRILHRTKDHSLVGELVEKGIISEQEAESHPNKNIILRAIQGTFIKPSKADFYIVSGIKSNDYFFLCTDGILESISDPMLVSILKSSSADEEKIEEIEQLCKEQSCDNYTAILVKTS